MTKTLNERAEELYELAHTGVSDELDSPGDRAEIMRSLREDQALMAWLQANGRVLEDDIRNLYMWTMGAAIITNSGEARGFSEEEISAAIKLCREYYGPPPPPPAKRKKSRARR